MKSGALPAAASATLTQRAGVLFNAENLIQKANLQRYCFSAGFIIKLKISDNFQVYHFPAKLFKIHE